MTNTNARNELTTNLRFALRLWRYAKARGLSFAQFHLAKVKACLAALAWNMSIEMLETLTTEPMVVWS